MKRWSNSETRICLQFSLFSFVLKFRICHKVHQRKCKFGSKSKSSWHWLCSPIVLHCSHFILFQFKGCLGNVQQPHHPHRGHFVMMMISFLTFQFHQYLISYSFASNNHCWELVYFWGGIIHSRVSALSWRLRSHIPSKSRVRVFIV